MSERARRPVGIAVIGAGMGSRPHFAALDDLARVGAVSVVAVHVRDAARRRAAAERLGCRQAEDVAAIAADPEVDAVLLLTPPNARTGIVTTLAAAGKPVLMEKPVERTLAAATGLVEAMERAGLPLGIVLQHRMEPAARHLAGLIAEGGLGAPRLVHLDVRWWRGQDYYDEPGRGSFARDGGGVLISQAIHALDLMLTLAGPVATVQAMTATTGLHRMESEDFAAAGLVFGNGAVGSVSATTAAWPGSEEAMALVFDAATATLTGGRLEVAWRDGRRDSLGQSRGTGGGADPMAFDHGLHREVIADFARALVEGRPPAITGRSALGVHLLIDAIATSSAQGARVEVAQQ